MDWKPVKEVKEACRAFPPSCLWFPAPEVGPSHVKLLLFAWDARTSTVHRYRNDHETTMDAETPREVILLASCRCFWRMTAEWPKREGLAPCCILVANIMRTRPWCPQGSRAFYSKTLFYIVLWNWCHQVWPSRRAKRVYLSKYRLTWSIASTSYFWGVELQTWLDSDRSRMEFMKVNHFRWVVYHRFPILEMSEYWRSRRIALMRMAISTSFMAIENLLGTMEPYKLWRTLTGLRLTSFHCQVASFFPPLSSSNFLSFTQPAGMLLPGAPTMNALNGVVSGRLNEGPKSLRSEFSRLVKHTRHTTLATYVFLTQVDLHSSSGARARHDVDRDRFGAEGVSMLRPTKIGRSKRGQSQDNDSRLICGFHTR